MHIAALPDERALSASSRRHPAALAPRLEPMLARPGAPFRSASTHVAALPDGRALSASEEGPCGFGTSPRGRCLRVLGGHSGSDQSCHGAARRARPLGVRGQDPAALGPRLGEMPARPGGTFGYRSSHVATLSDGAPFSFCRSGLFKALGPRLGGMPARPGGPFRFGQSRRGAARRARPLGVIRQHPAALGPRLGQMPARPGRTFRSGQITSCRCPTGAPSRRLTTAPCGFGTSPLGSACACWRATPVSSVTSRRCPTARPLGVRRQELEALGPCGGQGVGGLFSDSPITCLHISQISGSSFSRRASRRWLSSALD